MIASAGLPQRDIWVLELLGRVVRPVQRKAQRQVEHLFQTLLHRAFQGEL